MSENTPLEHKIWVDTLFGSETRKGMVSLSFEDKAVQLGPEDAQAIGLELIQAAEIARTETFMVNFLEHISGDTMDLQHVAALLQQVREYRLSERKPDVSEE